jgi:sulfur-oxidizing protein SoxY
MPIRATALHPVLHFALAVALWVGSPLGAWAGSTWDDLKPMIYGARPIAPGDGIINFRTPTRAENDSQVPVSVDAHFADGRQVKAVSFIIDENPMPVVARFSMPEPKDKVGIGVNIRMNGPSPVRAVVEASDGQLYMIEHLVKTSGLGACAAPPVTDPKLVASTLGQMALSDVTPLSGKGNTTQLNRRARLDIRHPQATGMQMDQITLLFIPARYVSEVAVYQGEDHLFDMTSGFALAENPHIEFDYRLNGAGEMSVKMKDTDGAAFEGRFPVGVGG